jgi:hypothetical protein
MGKIIDFLKKWGLLILSLIMFLKTCNLSSKVEKLTNETNRRMDQLDSIVKNETLSKEDFQNMLMIEGLKSEKRMIQSTDRKILDVTRQSEIDKELEKLESK